jgi:uncharacterized protein YdeI (YjbR/CyaY-like superfamily)
MLEPKKERIQAFADPAAFCTWLKNNHDSETELWVKIFKKGSGQQSINWEEAVIESLCWGWIDGVKKPLDEATYLQRFTPRRRNSNWSKRNREHVERLISDNRMQESGLVHVLVAQADGRWAAAYAPSSEMTLPEDFLAALEHMPKAKMFFASLNKANRYAIAYRLQTARKPETRQKRFVALLTMLENGEKFH